MTAGLIALIALPFAVFYWMLPFVRSSLTIGQDYAVISPVEQLHLMFSLKTGAIPQFIPEYAGGGVSSATLTLGQLFHPISHLASWFPNYWHGGAFEVYTFLNLLSLGLAHALLYRATRRLGVSPGWAFAVTCIAVYNTRTLDLFRFGASLQNGVGLILAAAWIVLCWTGRLSLGRWTVLVGFLYLLITGGHPQMMYYALLGAAVIALAVPWTWGENRGPGVSVVRYYAFCGGAAVAALVLSAAYTVPFVLDFLQNNSGRADRDFAWALNHPNDYMNLVGVSDALLRPLHTNNQTAYGASALMVVPVFAPLVWILAKKKSWGAAALWLAGAALFCFPLGDKTPLYHFFWQHFPFASAFRVPGRATMILPVLLWALLVWLLQRPPVRVTLNAKGGGRSAMTLEPIGIAAAAAGLLWTVYHALPLARLENLQYVTAHPNVINALRPWHDAVYFALGLLTLGAAVAASVGSRRTRFWKILLCALVVVQCAFTLRYGTWVKEKLEYDTFTQKGSDYRRYLQDSISLDRMKQEQRRKLRFVGVVSMGMTPRNVLEHAKKTQKVISHDPLAVFYWGALIVPLNSDPYAFKGLFNDAKNCVIRQGEADAPRRLPAAADAAGRIELVYSHFNRLTFKTSSVTPGFFVLSIPYFSRWQAYVDSKRVPVAEANGIKMAVAVPAGEHTVEWRYFSPAAAAGMAVSLAGLGVLIFVWLIRRRVPVLAALLAAVALSAGLWLLWRSHLYTGQNLNTVYAWSSSPTSQVAQTPLP